MSIVLGIDLGTSGVKAIALNREGKIIASSTASYPLFQPKSGYSEQNPEDWWNGVVKVIREIVKDPQIKKNSIGALALSGQMHGSVFLDKDQKVIRYPLLWNDTRNHEQCRFITEKIGEKQLLSLVGNPALEGFTAPKVLWLRDNEPQNYEKLSTLLLPKDYINYKLTGELTTETSDAAGTLLLNVKQRKWSEELVDKLGLDNKILPALLESTDVIGTISKEVAALSGLPESTKVIAGGADNACGAVGAGIVEEGIILVSIGSSGVVLAHTDQMHHDPAGRIHSFNHSVPGMWYLMGVMLSAGLSMSWFKNQIARQDYDWINRQAETVKPGAENLLFLPYLSGERTPHRDPMARGAFFGLSAIHEMKHLSRAVFEGVAFGLNDSLELIKELGIQPKQIRLTGGGAKSKLWRQIIADVFGQSLVTMQSEEGPAFGAALIAATGAGWYASLKEAVNETVGIGERVDPIQENIAVYHEYYQRFTSLYKSTKTEFSALHSMS